MKGIRRYIRSHRQAWKCYRNAFFVITKKMMKKDPKVRLTPDDFAVIEAMKTVLAYERDRRICWEDRRYQRATDWELYRLSYQDGFHCANWLIDNLNHGYYIEPDDIEFAEAFKTILAYSKEYKLAPVFYGSGELQHIINQFNIVIGCAKKGCRVPVCPR